MRSQASEDSIVASKSLARRLALLIQPNVRSTNACTMLPTGGLACGRGPAWSIRRRNPENDLDCVTVDFDAPHEDTYDFLHADTIETIEASGDLGREIFQAAYHERKVALDLDGVKRGSMPLLELGKALFQTRDTRLELRLVDESLCIAVDQPSDAAPHRGYLLIETGDLVRHPGSITRQADASPIFVGHAVRLLQERSHLAPNDLLQLVAAHRPILACSFAVETVEAHRERRLRPAQLATPEIQKQAAQTGRAKAPNGAACCISILPADAG
jgi:hypothetical protein